MGIGRKSTDKDAARAAKFGRNRGGSAKDAEAYARSKQPKTSPFAQARAAARKGGRR